MARCPKGAALSEFLRLAAIETVDCVIWPYGCDSSGYGSLRLEGRTRRVHALACERRHGPAPFPRAHAAHSCHTPACMNYRHLRWATASENGLDQVADGTSNRGERHGLHRLTEVEVLEIRRRYAAGDILQRELAEEFGVSSKTVSGLTRGASWSWLP